MRSVGLNKVSLAFPAVIALAVMIALATVGASAAADQQDVTYSVTIENLSSGQPFTPPVVAAHTGGLDVWRFGSAASDEVREIAENGNNDPLVALLNASAAVSDSTVGTAPVMPGESVTLTLEAPAGSFLLAVFKLICTNDGFSGVNFLTLQAFSPVSHDPSITSRITANVPAYDAGTEDNTEDFADIVPPCQSLIGVSSADEGTGTSDPALAEGGVITDLPGIQGGDDLTVGHHGWTGAVVKIMVSAAVAGLPNSGGVPPDSGSSNLWAVLVAVIGAVLLTAGGTAFVVSRRTDR